MKQEMPKCRYCGGDVKINPAPVIGIRFTWYCPHCGVCSDYDFPTREAAIADASRKAAVISEDEVADLSEAIQHLITWSKAYPEDVWIPHTRESLKEVAALLEANGKTLDALSAHILRVAMKSLVKVFEPVIKTLTRLGVPC